MSEGDDQGFKIRDRRRFDVDGSPRDGEDPPPAQDPAPPPGDSGAAESPAGDMPAIDFSTFLLSLSTSAMVHLGEAPTPDGEVGNNLQMARQVIDILALLENKTQGNLTAEEQKLLGDLLYDLRMRFVSASR